MALGQKSNQLRKLLRSVGLLVTSRAAIPHKLSFSLLPTKVPELSECVPSGRNTADL